MKAPGTAYDDPKLGKDDQPGTMVGYVHTAEDNGGVHTNSGIPNHAFYLVAVAIGGRSWEKAGQIWYDTLTDHTLSESQCELRDFCESDCKACWQPIWREQRGTEGGSGRMDESGRP